MVGYKLSKNDWVTPLFVIFRSVREKLLVTVFLEHPIITSPNQVKEAVILGHDGNVWAASQDFSVSSKALCCLIWENIFHCFYSDKIKPFYLVMQNNNR